MEKAYGLDQQILDERGIGLTVSQVVNLSSSEYSARLRRLCLPPRDEAFVRRLRRRIKNRMASQNSRRRTAEHIRALKADLRAVRSGKQRALDEGRSLQRQRDALSERCRDLADYLLQELSERNDSTPLPVKLEPRVPQDMTRMIADPKAYESRLENLVVRRIEEIYRLEKEKSTANDILDCTTFKAKDLDMRLKDSELKTKFKTEDKETHKVSINDNILNEREVAKKISNLKMKTEYVKVADQGSSLGEPPKIIHAKCVFLEPANGSIDSNTKNIKKKNFVCKDNEYKDNLSDLKPKKVIKKKSCIVHTSDLQYETYFNSVQSKDKHFKDGVEMRETEVLDLCVKREAGPRRRLHGRKQAAPRRVTYVNQEDDIVLDLKIRNGD